VTASIFISYSRRDSAYVGRLVAYLRGNDLPAWADSAINYGDHWEDVICKQIDDCAAFVPVMTPAAWASPWVRNEVARARLKDKPILPLLLQGEHFFGLSHLEAEDVTAGQLPQPAFLARLHALVGDTAVRPVVPAEAGPDRRRPGWLWPAVVGLAVLLLLGAIVGLAVANRPSPAARVTPPVVTSAGGGSPSPAAGGPVVDHLAAPAAIGQLTLSYVSPTAGPTAASSFTYQIHDRTGTTNLIYHDPANVNVQVSIMATTGTVTNYQSLVEAYLPGLDPATLHPVNPGHLSGVAKCGAVKEAPQVIDCAWTDPGSIGQVLCTGLSQPACEALFPKVRDAVLTRS
jgi:hypothetical protein